MTKEINFFQNEVETVTFEPPENLESAHNPEASQVSEPSQSLVPPQILGSSQTKSLDLSEDRSPEEDMASADWGQIDQQLQQHLKRVIEALLFASPDPLSLVKIREITDTIMQLRPRQLRQIIEELKQDYLTQQRAFQLEEIAQGYVLRTHEEYAPYLDLLHRQKRGEKLSHASTEVLAIVAYRQPITRPQIDAIRGVDSSGTLMQLLERQLIEPIGKLEAPGRPTLYGTTKEFLKHFGLKDLIELKNQP